MRFDRPRLGLLFATLVVMHSDLSIANDLLDESRTKFMQAYKDVRYDQLCELLDKDASFRGRVIPGKWSHTADQIITDRWRSKYTCTEIAQGKNSERQKIDIFTVGQTDLELTPSRAATLLGDQGHENYAVDVGDFRMKAKDPKKEDMVGSYVILWKRAEKSWKMMHIDMNPEGAVDVKK